MARLAYTALGDSPTRLHKIQHNSNHPQSTTAYAISGADSANLTSQATYREPVAVDSQDVEYLHTFLQLVPISENLTLNAQLLASVQLHLRMECEACCSDEILAHLGRKSAVN